MNHLSVKPQLLVYCLVFVLHKMFNPHYIHRNVLITHLEMEPKSIVNNQTKLRLFTIRQSSQTRDTIIILCIICEVYFHLFSHPNLIEKYRFSKTLKSNNQKMSNSSQTTCIEMSYVCFIFRAMLNYYIPFIFDRGSFFLTLI